MEQPGKPLAVGVIGAGWVATDRHIPSFQRDRRVRIDALLDPSPEKARAVARRHHIPHTYRELPDSWPTGWTSSPSAHRPGRTRPSQSRRCAAAATCW
jgi:hypothetical protein